MSERPTTNAPHGKVWYVSYGSNLLRKRMLCYVRGGTPEGAQKHYDGCADKTEPGQDLVVPLRKKLYFAKKSKTWQCGGVAFVTEDDCDAETVGRAYLVTREQLEDIMAQENGKDPGDVSVDWERLDTKGEFRRQRGWYSVLLRLDDIDDLHAYTLTGPSSHQGETNQPSKAYLAIVRKGLKECCPEWSASQIDAYLQAARGI